MRKFAILAALAIATPALAAPNTTQMRFSDSPSVICGSEATARQWFYEYDHSLSFTVFKDNPLEKGVNPRTADGASCSPNLLAAVDNPPVSVLERHGAFCNIRVHDGDLERITVWTVCLWLRFEK